MTETLTAAQERYREAMREANDVAQRLEEAGEEGRLAGLAVTVDVGTSAAFMFEVSDRAYENATEVIRLAVARATRPTEERG